jgi:hypothetical protein
VERCRRAISRYFCPLSLYIHPIHICSWTRRRPCLLHAHALSSIKAHANNPQTPCCSWQARPGRFHTSSGAYVSRCRYKRKMTGFKKGIAPHALPSAFVRFSRCSMARLRGILPALWSFARSAVPRCIRPFALTLPSAVV